MQTFDFWNYEIHITEKSDFDWKNECYPWVQPFFCCKQVHSKLVHEWNPDWKNETEGDGLYSNQKGIWLKVGVSDCNAVAVMGKERFGIVHAGRKGLQLGIIENLIEKLQAKGESDFKVFLWPAIRKCCYEVGAEFSERCEAQYLMPQANDAKLSILCLKRMGSFISICWEWSRIAWKPFLAMRSISILNAPNAESIFSVIGGRTVSIILYL